MIGHQIYLILGIFPLGHHFPFYTSPSGDKSQSIPEWAFASYWVFTVMPKTCGHIERGWF